jgi:ubiquitin-like 1-activating enzyme E1 B
MFYYSSQLFGSEDPDEAVSPDAEDPENMAEAGQAAYEKKTEIVRLSTRTWAKQTSYDGQKIFNKLFNEDIKYLLSMAKLWEKRKKPEALLFEQVNQSEDGAATNGQNGTQLNSQKVWTVKECAEQFCSSLSALKTRLSEDENAILVWDKVSSCLFYHAKAV